MKDKKQVRKNETKEISKEKGINIMLEDYLNIRKKLIALGYAMAIISWDSETEAPSGCFEYRSKQIGVLAEEVYKLQTSADYFKLIEGLLIDDHDLNSDLKHELNEVKKQISKTKKIPMDRYVTFQVTIAKSQQLWAKAKESNDYQMFKPVLAEIINFLHEYIGYLETPELNGYDILLDQYEPGMKIDDYDKFFNELKTRLVPFVKKVLSLEKKADYSFGEEEYPIEEQKRFCLYLQDVLGFDRNRGLMKTSAHPFTSGISSTDVRFTNHYYPHNFTSAIFSAIHEMGHAIYEQQGDPKYDGTFISGGASLGIHESQSRFYENIVGRDYFFWEKHYPQLQKHFPLQLKNVSLDTFYHYINKVEASFIRTDADELTYSLHIMLRYEIEKAIFRDNLPLEDLESKWNELFFDYFGLKVPSAREGILQDIHWSGGMFGYFPTYALGSAYSAQILYHLKKDLAFEDIIKSASLAPLNNWLKEKIHKYAASKYPKEIIYNALGEDFNVTYYIDYLINKYSKIYGIDPS